MSPTDRELDLILEQLRDLRASDEAIKATLAKIQHQLAERAGRERNGRLVLNAIFALAGALFSALVSIGSVYMQTITK